MKFFHGYLTDIVQREPTVHPHKKWQHLLPLFKPCGVSAPGSQPSSLTVSVLVQSMSVSARARLNFCPHFAPQGQLSCDWRFPRHMSMHWRCPVKANAIEAIYAVLRKFAHLASISLFLNPLPETPLPLRRNIAAAMFCFVFDQLFEPHLPLQWASLLQRPLEADAIQLVDAVFR